MSDAALPALWRYPERADMVRPALDAWLREHVGGTWQLWRGAAVVRGLAARAAEVTALGEELATLDDDALANAAREEGIAVRRRHNRSGGGAAVSVRLFALVREAATRGLGFRPHETQVMGALSLWRGAIAEMATGEGKTAVAAMCAAAAALCGRSVHVITVNDYLAARDAELMAPLFARLGLTVGTVVAGMSPDDRRTGYGAAICYSTSKEVVFDHLRDRLAQGVERGAMRARLRPTRDDAPGLLMRGLDFAIVDEADSVLVDAARTPLILSGEQDSQVDEGTADQALALVEQLEQGCDWHALPRQHMVLLTEAGEARLETMVENDPALAASAAWSVPRVREELARHALAARHLFHRGEHYLARDCGVQIIDEFTGRTMPDRQWADGLHQMIERKEGLTLTRRRITLARLTFQRFFPRYRHLAGMTGTAAEVAGEFWAVYGMTVDRIPTHRPSRRLLARDRVLPDTEAKWTAVAAEAMVMRAAGRPVLIGTRTVSASRLASAALTALGLPHDVLSADQDAAEAAVIAHAGEPGRITVATNMAGRGTDIRISAGTVAAGGLAVLLTERHEAGRIDRQLAGRVARQGDPGSCVAILAADDPLLAAAVAPIRLLARLIQHLPSGALRDRLASFAFRQAQRGLERAHAAARQALLRRDRRRADRLGFAGMGE
ncbi:MAG: preprotein translocase subunit SecA [Acetobacteraceae bacterium]|nr:preprotein translocase subunit SecA [Acetobacteraceae bacterium]